MERFGGSVRASAFIVAGKRFEGGFLPCLF